jgi:FixJ family two-component response regulator
MSTRGTVFLVDDDGALRRATSRLMTAAGFTVAAFASAEEFLGAFDAAAPGCLVLDLRMPGLGGLDLQRALAERGAELPIIFLSGQADVGASVHAMKGGAIDFLEKPVEEAVLIAAVERALERDATLRGARSSRTELERRYAQLTPREREVLALIVAGKLNKQAASSLGIAERTIKLHRSRVLEKMKAPSLADLVRMAEQLGIGR